MNLGSEENDLRRMFDRLKQADDAAVPSFDSRPLAAAGPERSVLASLRYGRIAAVFLLIAGVGFVVAHRSQSPSIAIKAPASSTSGPDLGMGGASVSLDNWQSPTAFLLQDADDWGTAADVADDASGHSPSTQPNPPRSRHAT